MAKKRLHSKPHQRPHRDGSERLSLVPLSFEEAVKAALATPPPEDDEGDVEVIEVIEEG